MIILAKLIHSCQQVLFQHVRISDEKPFHHKIPDELYPLHAEIPTQADEFLGCTYMECRIGPHVVKHYPFLKFSLFKFYFPCIQNKHTSP